MTLDDQGFLSGISCPRCHLAMKFLHQEGNIWKKWRCVCCHLAVFDCGPCKDSDHSKKIEEGG